MSLVEHVLLCLQKRREKKEIYEERKWWSSINMLMHGDSTAIALLNWWMLKEGVGFVSGCAWVLLGFQERKSRMFWLILIHVSYESQEVNVWLWLADELWQISQTGVQSIRPTYAAYAQLLPETYNIVVLFGTQGPTFLDASNVCCSHQCLFRECSLQSSWEISSWIHSVK